MLFNPAFRSGRLQKDFVSPERRRFYPEGYLQPFDAGAELRQQQSREDAGGDHVRAEPHGWTPQQTATLQRASAAYSRTTTAGTAGKGTDTMIVNGRGSLLWHPADERDLN